VGLSECNSSFGAGLFSFGWHRLSRLSVVVVANVMAWVLRSCHPKSTKIKNELQHTTLQIKTPSLELSSTAQRRFAFVDEHYEAVSGTQVGQSDL
jgi:hypothetical protein